MMDIFSIADLIRNIITDLFKDGIWVMAFFFLLTNTFKNDKVKMISGYIVGISMLLLFFSYIMTGIWTFS
jgi:hypothetical protein